MFLGRLEVSGGHASIHVALHGTLLCCLVGVSRVLTGQGEGRAECWKHPLLSFSLSRTVRAKYRESPPSLPPVTRANQTTTPKRWSALIEHLLGADIGCLPRIPRPSPGQGGSHTMRRWLCVQGAPTTSANILVSLTRDTRMTRCWEGSRAQAGEDIWARFPQAALHSCSQNDLYAAGHQPGWGGGGGGGVGQSLEGALGRLAAGGLIPMWIQDRTQRQICQSESQVFAFLKKRAEEKQESTPL